MSNKAFSLIELSIVLIIIGLLVAGVTGGASLIQSAKSRAIMNELREWKQNVYTFQVAKGRYPGDVMNYGTFGWNGNYEKNSNAAQPYYEYKATDFPSSFIAEFQKTAGTSVIPNYDSAPFVELYNEGIIDFKPLGNEMTGDKNNSKKGAPSLKSEPNVFIFFVHIGTNREDYMYTLCQNDNENCNYQRGIGYEGQLKESIYSQYLNSSQTNGFDPRLLKNIDKKLDDGSFNTGMVRGSCYGSKNSGYNTYDNAIESGKKCNKFHYVI